MWTSHRSPWTPSLRRGRACAPGGPPGRAPRGGRPPRRTTSTPRPSVRLDLGARVLLGQVDRRARRTRAPSPAARRRVDRDHLGGARRRGGLHGAQPDRAEAEHGGDSPALQAGSRPRGSRCPSRRRRTARRRRPGPRAPGAASGWRAGRAPARPARPAARRASRRGRRCAPASQLWNSPRRQKKQRPQAVTKQPITRSPTASSRDVVAGGDDRADELVADREARLDGDAAVVDVQVRAADAGRLDADDASSGSIELRLGLLLDPDLAGRLEGDGAHRGQPYRPPPDGEVSRIPDV